MQGDLHQDGLKNKRDITQMKIMIDSNIGSRLERGFPLSPL